MYLHRWRWRFVDLTDPVKDLETESPKLKFDLRDPGKDKETGVENAVLKSIDLNNNPGRFRD